MKGVQGSYVGVFLWIVDVHRFSLCIQTNLTPDIQDSYFYIKSVGIITKNPSETLHPER